MNLNDFIELKKVFNEANEHGVLGFYENFLGKYPQVQITDDCLKKHATGTVSVSSREDDEYPIHISFEYAGHEFFTVMTTEEYELEFKDWITEHNEIQAMEDTEFITDRPRGMPVDELKLKDSGHKESNFR